VTGLADNVRPNVSSLFWCIRQFN